VQRLTSDGFVADWPADPKPVNLTTGASTWKSRLRTSRKKDHPEWQKRPSGRTALNRQVALEFHLLHLEFHFDLERLHDGFEGDRFVAV